MREALKFGVVGGVAFVIDVGVFNLLRFGPGDLLGHKPLTAKAISVIVATAFSWYANRQWTFRHRKTDRPHVEMVQFAVINVVGLLIGVGCLWVSHYLLGFTSALADNISANGVGLVLGMLFRFWAYRSFVFTAAESKASVAGRDAVHPEGVDGVDTVGPDAVDPGASRS